MNVRIVDRCIYMLFEEHKLNSVLIMREKVISSMMAVDKGPELGVKMSAGE